MLIPRKLFFVTAVAGVFAAGCLAEEAQQHSHTVQDSCIKAAPGRSEEFQAFIRDVEVPLHQAEADAGDFTAWLAARAVIPAGDSAKCDYRLAAIYNHGIADFPSPEQTEAAIKRANLNISLQDYLKQRDALAHVVAVEIWVGIAGAGTQQMKDDFIRFNHYNVEPNAGGDWTRIETTHWKPLVEEWTKAGNKGSWAMYWLWMPQGENQLYNALTYDDFPDWNSLVQGGHALIALWPKVHPGIDATEVVSNQMDRVSSLHNVEIYKIIEQVVANRAGQN